MIEAFPGFKLPTFPQLIEQTIAAGRVTSANIQCVGISINTSSLPAEDREAYLAKISDEIGLPCVDPVATGVGPIVDHVVATYK